MHCQRVCRFVPGLTVFLLLLGGCGSTSAPPSVDEGAIGAAPAGADPKRDFDLQTLRPISTSVIDDSRIGSAGVAPGVYLFKTAQRYQQLIGPPPQDLDFTKQWAVLYVVPLESLSGRGQPVVKVVQLASKTGSTSWDLVADVTISRPGDGCPLIASLTQPWQLVAFDAPTDPIAQAVWYKIDDEQGPSCTATWQATCGDPVCGGPNGGHHTHPGIPACTTEQGGAACSAVGTECDPGSDCNSLLKCSVENPRINCPISRKSFKRDIEYLGQSGLESYAKALLALPLATYQYKADPAPAAKRVGVLIEDVKSAELLTEGGKRIDLYSYASMAVAALKVQAAQIQALQSEVATLKKALDKR